MSLSRNDLLALVASTITTNGNEEVTAADIRSVLDQMIDSDLNLFDDPPRYISYLIPISTGSQLSGALDSTKQYFINGVVDISGISIVVPADGLNFAGLGASLSRLVSTSSAYTMFTGGGNVNGNGVAIEASGAGSKVYDLTSPTGFEAVEMLNVNYENCTSLGELTNYRQYLETNSGRFGGDPSLTLSGSMSGAKIDVSLALNMSDTTTEPLFKSGTALVMSGRFSTNINCDLGALQRFTDFTPANFSNPSSFVINSARFSRNGVINAGDTNINSGITKGAIECRWSDNVGISNTFEGGTLTVTTASATALSGVAIGAYLDLAGTFAAAKLEHFDSPANGQIRHLGSSPSDYKFYAGVDIAGTAGDLVTVKVVMWDDSAASFVDIKSQTREINNFTGSSDKAFFNFQGLPFMDENDYLKLQVNNSTAARNVTAQVDGSLVVEAR